MKYFSKLVELSKIGYGGEKHQLIASCILIATNELSYGLRTCEKACRDSLREGTGESIVILQISIACFLNSVVAESEVALRPELWFARATCITPCCIGLVSGACKGSGWSPAMHIPISITYHASVSLVTQASYQQIWAFRSHCFWSYMAIFPQRSYGGELFRKSLPTISIVNTSDIIILFARSDRKT